MLYNLMDELMLENSSSYTCSFLKSTNMYHKPSRMEQGVIFPTPDTEQVSFQIRPVRVEKMDQRPQEKSC